MNARSYSRDFALENITFDTPISLAGKEFAPRDSAASDNAIDA
jgi:hypothetical protein